MQSPDRGGSEPRRVHYNDDDDDDDDGAGGGHGGSGGSVSGATEGSLDDVRSPRAVVGDEAADADAAAALGLPYFDVGTLRDELRAAFRELLREDEGGTAVYWFEEVEKRHGPHSWARVLVVGDEATYLAEPRTAGVARCLPHAALAGLHTCEEDPALLGVECPSQYDLLLGLPSEQSVQAVGGLLARLAPGARHTHHGDAAELAAALSLQRPDGYRAPFDVKLRRRAAAAAAAAAAPQPQQPSPTAADAVGDSKKRRLEHRRSMVGGAPALHSVPPLVAARNHWRTVGRAAAGSEVVAYVDELEERCAEVESQLAAMQEQASIEIEQLGEELSIKDSIAAEWTRRHSTLKARERQLELEVKRLGEAHDGLRTSLDEAESLAVSLKQRSHILERENAALVRDKEAVRESLACMTSAGEGGGGEPPYDTALSLTDAVKRALANSEKLQDDNWRLVKQVAEMEKKLGATSRLKAAEPAAAVPAAAPQSDVDVVEGGGASPDSRLDVIDALESENAQVKKALHATQAAHEETKLREFDWEQKHAALLERHADVTQAQRSTVRGLERRLARLALNKPPEEQFSTRFSPDPPSPPTASFAPAGDEPSVGARVSTVMRGSIVTGTVKFVGMTDFAKGVWVGVALDAALGKHDGTIHGKEYFRCEQGCGVFLREDALSVEAAHCVRCLDGGGGGGGGGPRRHLRMQDSTATHPHHASGGGGGGGGPPSRAHASSHSPAHTSSRLRSQTAQGRSEQEEEYLRLSLTLRAQLDRATARNTSDKETIRLLQMNLAKANAIMSPTSQRWGRSPSKSAATECSDAGTAPDEGKRLPSASITRMSPVAPSMPPTP